jgi:hypothetical protein
MLPVTFQVPAAVLLLVGGIVACFFGYRLFRIVLAVFGFILGAFVSSSIFGVSDTTPMLVAAVLGGIFGALLLVAAYFVAVALIGAGIGAVIANVLLAQGDAPAGVWWVAGFAVVGAAAAMYLQRYVIIVGTGFGGAWTLLVGALTLVGELTAPVEATGEPVWVAYLLDPVQERQWVLVAWFALGVAGTAVQLGVTGGEGGRVVGRTKK